MNLSHCSVGCHQETLSCSLVFCTWCVQEIMLVRQALLESYAIYSHVQVSYRWIPKVATFLVIYDGHGLKFASKLHLSAFVGDIGLLKYSDVINIDLLGILNWCRDHIASGSQDKVYGLLGIRHQRFEHDSGGSDVDYTATAAQVYLNTALEVLHVWNERKPLELVIRLDGINHSGEFLSWVPRWNQQRDNNHTAAEDIQEFRNVFLEMKDNNVPLCWELRSD